LAILEILSPRKYVALWYVIVIIQYEYDVFIITQLQSWGRVLITKISYKCTWANIPNDYANLCYYCGRNNKKWFVVMFNYHLVVFTYKHFLCTINSWLLYYPTLMMHWFSRVKNWSAVFWRYVGYWLPSYWKCTAKLADQNVYWSTKCWNWSEIGQWLSRISLLIQETQGKTQVKC